ncbi:CobW family GTP-binding protein [Streptomyces sp. NPDC050560]|uniref:CobW family GTP-binding protein n=1 Tax=Streptomyces sp. NPDC050560 TaxID=3365630 RepID=UPI0037A03C9B
MSPQQIPVIVLAGFLGSGKTTLLNHLLHTGGGTRIGAVVNDFGAIDIDAMAVAGSLGDSTVSLGNGCLCCSVDVSELDTSLDVLTRPSAGIDVVIIEASGLAEPGELVRMVLASGNPRVAYGGLVEVIDAAEFDASRERHPELERHVGIADLVVLNKTDRVTPEDRERLLARVRDLNAHGAVVCASHGRVDPELLFDRKAVTERFGQLSFDDLREREEGGPGGHQGHLHAAYDTVSFTSAVPLDPRRTTAFLDSRPPGLYRIKGHVDFGAADPRNRYGLHTVGGAVRFTPEPWAPGQERGSALVLIGSGVDTESLLAALTACRSIAEQAPEGEGAEGAGEDDAAMWGVLRFVAAAQDEEEPRRPEPEPGPEDPALAP